MTSKTVIISPFSQKMRNNSINPKNFPYWTEVSKMLNSHGVTVIQVGLHNEPDIGANRRMDNLALRELYKLVQECDTWASVDNFFHHMCAWLKKPGVVVFGKSDPKIYGHPINISLVKDRQMLRKLQFDIWEAETFDSSVFVSPEIVTSAILSLAGSTSFSAI